MDVIFETNTGKEFSIEIWFFATALEMKQAVEKYHGIPVASQTLLFNGQVMADEGNTELYGICQGSRIQLVVAGAEPEVVEIDPPQTAATAATRRIKVLVLPKDGAKKVAVEVDPTDNVSELRRELERIRVMQMHNLELPSQYFFIHRQGVMEEEHSFRWHGVRHGDTVEVFKGSVSQS